MSSRKYLIVFLMALLALVLVACGGSAETPAAEEPTTAPVVEEPAAEEPAAEEPAAEEPAAEEPAAEEPAAEQPASGDRVRVRWFVGLGAGSDATAVAAQEAFRDAYNASQNQYELVLEIVDNDVAYDTLATQIAAGNAPDIVGPVGIRGRDSFKGAWLDLQPYIDSTNYDLSDFDPALVDFYRVQEEGQLGIPFAIFPSFVIYNANLFDEAGLPYPPHKYGEPYVNVDGVEQEWNIETLTELAKLLTVDANGNDANSPDFDSANIVQFGWQNQWTDARGIGTFFGAGTFVAEDGSAQIPQPWIEAWKWTYDGMWNQWFIPNGPYGAAEFLQGPGGPFSSGNVAMIHNHMWFVAPWALGDMPFTWDLAATPSYNGQVTSKMHADTFGILKGSKNPDAAFAVLSYMLSAEGASQLLNVYGGMPARLSMQDNYFDTYSETNFPGLDIDWQVVVDSMPYADNPNHESYMPSFQEANDKYNEYWNRWAETPGLDLDAEIQSLQQDLDRIFSAASGN